eukprot:2509082-Pleurochrysis_carterae.AAC.1
MLAQTHLHEDAQSRITRKHKHGRMHARRTRPLARTPTRTHARTRAHTHARAHARTHARKHARTHACTLTPVASPVFGRARAGSVAERITLLSYAAINMAMMGLMKTLSTLSAEAPVVGRERARKWYGACEYLFAKMVAEVPLDAAFSAGFGLLLKLRCGLAARSHALVGLLALNGACCAALGLAIGSAVPGGDAAMAAGAAEGEE